MGGLVALLLVGYGGYCALRGKAMALNLGLRHFPNPARGLLREVAGPAATSLGMMFVCLGLFAHFHWFWSHHETLHGYAEIGKLLSAVGIVISVGYHVYLVLA